MISFQKTWRQLWTRDSTILLGGFFVTIFLIIYIWWPLAQEYLAYVDWDGEWWRYLDWLLLGIFGFMSVTIIAGADLKTDLPIIFVGICGGLAIESWGTQTNLWFYYTDERPPLWIIPAWPIASLSIDRITRFLDWLIAQVGRQIKPLSLNSPISTSLTLAPHARLPRVQVPGSAGVSFLYWLTFSAFLGLMLVFVAPTLNKSFTWLAVGLCILLILTPTDHCFALLTFVAGAGLGYTLELWGTTRGCWTYYTYQTPPLFAVLAHGMAAVAFWRAGLMLKVLWGRFGFSKPLQVSAAREQGQDFVRK
ncbi:MAG TPA: hypothetical protein VJ785_05275 [Anaerolineales bacterium]|nr:hypothetical protein [Anaerolineales bacterium]